MEINLWNIMQGVFTVAYAIGLGFIKHIYANIKELIAENKQEIIDLKLENKKLKEEFLTCPNRHKNFATKEDIEEIIAHQLDKFQL